MAAEVDVDLDLMITRFAVARARWERINGPVLPDAEARWTGVDLRGGIPDELHEPSPSA